MNDVHQEMADGLDAQLASWAKTGTRVVLDTEGNAITRELTLGEWKLIADRCKALGLSAMPGANTSQDMLMRNAQAAARQGKVRLVGLPELDEAPDAATA